MSARAEPDMPQIASLAPKHRELRTPLNHILGYCKIIQEDTIELGWGDMGSELDRIHALAWEFLGQLDELLAFVEHLEVAQFAPKSGPSFVANAMAALRLPGAPGIDRKCGHVLVDRNNLEIKEFLKGAGR